MYVGVGSSPSFSSSFFLLPYTMKNHLLATFQAHIQSCMLDQPKYSILSRQPILDEKLADARVLENNLGVCG